MKTILKPKPLATFVKAKKTAEQRRISGAIARLAEECMLKPGEKGFDAVGEFLKVRRGIMIIVADASFLVAAFARADEHSFANLMDLSDSIT